LEGPKSLAHIPIMQILKTRIELENALAFIRGSEHTLGFVPTMGALHKGHISLLRKAQMENDYSITSIFVNPTQFNDPADYSKYPRQLAVDARMLEDVQCDFLFAPSSNDVYDGVRIENFDLGPHMHTLEGEFRPGHFHGVAAVVKLLLEMVQPTKAYFGLKDYQQFMVIKKLAEKYNLHSEIVGCEIIRNESGLALSSRNQLLSSEGKVVATNLSRALYQIRSQFGTIPIKQLLANGKNALSTTPGIRLEYLEIVDAKTLDSLSHAEQGKFGAIALLAAYVEDVRLIDNMFLTFPTGNMNA